MLATLESPALSNLYSGRFEEDAQWLAIRDNIYGAELLAVAVTSFNILSLLEEPVTAGVLRMSLQLAERPAEVMLTCLTALRIIGRDGERIWRTEASNEVLEGYSKWLQGPFDERPVYRSILEAMRTDSPSGWSANDVPWLEMMEDPVFATRFTSTTSSRGRYLGRALASRVPLKQHYRLLDIAGGSGVYSCCVATAYPHMRALVLEKQSIESFAKQMIDSSGHAERVGVAVLDMHADPLPEGYDVHLWSNVLHDWSEATVRTLLKKSFEYLPSGGLLIIHDVFTNRNRSGPVPAALRSVFFMVATEGMCHSLAFLERTIAEIGFAKTEIIPSIMDYSIILAIKP